MGWSGTRVGNSYQLLINSEFRMVSSSEFLLKGIDEIHLQHHRRKGDRNGVVLAD